MSASETDKQLLQSINERIGRVETLLEERCDGRLNLIQTNTHNIELLFNRINNTKGNGTKAILALCSVIAALTTTLTTIVLKVLGV